MHRPGSDVRVLRWYPLKPKLAFGTIDGNIDELLLRRLVDSKDCDHRFEVLMSKGVQDFPVPASWRESIEVPKPEPERRLGFLQIMKQKVSNLFTKLERKR